MITFVECAACAAKPGAPTLCPACLHNRTTINQLRAECEVLTKVYGIAACMRTFPVPFDDHFELVGAVDECRSVLEPPVDDYGPREAREASTVSVEFRLAMPVRGNWDNLWSGEKRNYALVREVDSQIAAALDGGSWTYCWPDGWQASITARILRAGDTQDPSHGFNGYEWMIESILRYRKIYADHERPEVRPNP